MPFTVTAAATVAAAPAPLDEDRPPPIAVFPITDAQLGLYGEQVVPIEHLEIGEVVCRGTLARQALAQLRAGDQVIVSGVLNPTSTAGAKLGESPYILLAIEATDVGISLATLTNGKGIEPWPADQ